MPVSSVASAALRDRSAFAWTPEPSGLSVVAQEKTMKTGEQMMAEYRAAPSTHVAGASPRLERRTAACL